MPLARSPLSAQHAMGSARRAALPLACALLMGLATPPLASSAEEAADEVGEFDLEALMDVDVTSVSKRKQKVSQSPAAVFVITEEDIRRSGATVLPELLRMVPGLHVARIDAQSWAISARGFTSENADNLLVMIDGRIVYSEPLYSSVIWNEHDLLLEDIERIEVVRGPGGALWGANAVNGVINIFTKAAKDTQGALATGITGSHEDGIGAARFGGAVGDDLHYRVYGKFARRNAFEQRSGESAVDGWKTGRGGARLDWTPTNKDSLTLQGEVVDLEADGRDLSGFRDTNDFQGAHLIARFAHAFSDTSSVTIQGYYDWVDREQSFLAEEIHTFDALVEHTFVPFTGHEVTWGGMYRVWKHDPDASFFSFRGGDRTLDKGSLFFQDDILLVPGLLWLNAGAKLDWNDFTGFEVQPSGRLLFTPHEDHTVWAAASRAVRTPSRAERDLELSFQVAPGVLFELLGNPRARSETVIAYELGYRVRPTDRVSLDFAGYINDYEHLSTTESSSAFVFPNFVTTFQFDNEARGKGYGLEASGTWSVMDPWRLTAGYTYTRVDLELETGSMDTGSALQFENDTPRSQIWLRSAFDLPCDLELDAAIYWIDRLRGQQGVPSYTRLDVRLAWEPMPGLELAVAGLNLVDEHREWPGGSTATTVEIPRSVHGSVRWEF